MRRLKRILRNKIFYVFLLFFIVLFPTALYSDAQIFKKAIGTILGIDKTETGVEVSVLILIPDKAKQEGSVQLECAEGRGVAEAIDKLNLELGRVIGLDHCEAIIFGEEAIKEDIAFYMDYLMRTNNMASNGQIINCKSTAKEFLGIMSKNNLEMVFYLRNMIIFDPRYLFTADTDVETFYKGYFTENSAVLVPIMVLEEFEAEPDSFSGETSNEEGGDSSGNASDSLSSSGGSSQSKPQKQVKSEGKAAVVKNGRKVRETTEEEVKGYNLLSKKIKEGNIRIENINDENFENGILDFEVSSQKVSRKVKFDGDKPYYDVKISLILKLDAAQSDNYNYQLQDSTVGYVTPQVKQRLNEELGVYINKVFEEMRINKTDTLDIARDFNRFYHKKWQKYLNSLEDKEAFLDGIEIQVEFKYKGKV